MGEQQVSLRPECRDAVSGPATSDETVLFLIKESVERRKGLIRGRLHDGNGGHCAMGCMWADNPKVVVRSALLEEVATVNDSVPATATPQERWKTVRSWLRLKLKAIAKKAQE